MFRKIVILSLLLLCSAFLTLGHAFAGDTTAPAPTLFCGATITPNPFSPDGDAVNDAQAFKFCLKKSAHVTVTISNYKGVVKNMYGGPYRVNGVLYNKYLGEGEHSIGWTGTNNSGVVLPNGNYSFKIVAKNGTLVETLSGVTSVQGKGVLGTVVSVTDGDTINVKIGANTFTVRYIGIDTPETVHPSVGVECYGKEASSYNSSLVLNKTVRLEKDVSEVDKYGRLLRYIWIGGVLVNEKLVRDGYAVSSSYPPDIRYQDRFLSAQTAARNEDLGLWKACGGANTPVGATSGTGTTPSPSTAPVADKDCGDFRTHDEAQAFFEANDPDNDPHQLDSDGDGLACESLP